VGGAEGDGFSLAKPVGDTIDAMLNTITAITNILKAFFMLNLPTQIIVTNILYLLYASMKPYL
jgi:hypothetical protein